MTNESASQYSEDIPALSVLEAQRPLETVAFATLKDDIIRASVYIDGFNLYYGALKNSPYKWLDVSKFAQNFLPPDYSIFKIKYFTARASGINDPDLPRRQQIYFSALKTIPELEIYEGNFLPKTKWRPLANFPIGGAIVPSLFNGTASVGNHVVSGGSLKSNSSIPIYTYNIGHQKNPRINNNGRPLSDALVVQIHDIEEKGSDVNLAAQLLNDAWKQEFDLALVISNDTDLVSPIEIVSKEKGLVVGVVSPGHKVAPGLQKVSNYQLHVNSSHLKSSQFPVTIPGTSITKPNTW